MKTYTVAQVAELLSVYPETVRRWIRGGDLKAEQSSRKGGNVISEESLREFLDKDSHARYRREAQKKFAVLVNSVPVVGTIAGASLSGATSGLASPIVSGILSVAIKAMASRKEADEQAKNAEYITNSIEQLKESISSKKLRAKQLQKEMEVLMREVAEEEQALSFLEETGNQ